MRDELKVPLGMSGLEGVPPDMAAKLEEHKAAGRVELKYDDKGNIIALRVTPKGLDELLGNIAARIRAAEQREVQQRFIRV